MISFASALYRYGVCFAMASNEVDTFANELSMRQIKQTPSRKTRREIRFSCRYQLNGNFVTSIARAVSILREITVTILFTFLVLKSRLV